MYQASVRKFARQLGAAAVAQLLAALLSPAGGLRGSPAHPRGLRSLAQPSGKINGEMVEIMRCCGMMWDD